jgi:hypothetical protein
MCVLDRVLVSTEWEFLFPLATVKVDTRIGSDHSPLLVSDVGISSIKTNRFYLEKQWFTMPDFREFVTCKWINALLSYTGDGTAIDCWHHCSTLLRKALRGWGANVNADIKKQKIDLLCKIKDIDSIADTVGLSANHWKIRYDLEHQLEEVLVWEEAYWSQRAHIQWLNEGDSNTAFFHSFANGRRRKCAIFSLMGDDGEVFEGAQLHDHIYSFYKKLFSRDQGGGLRLQESIWSGDQVVSPEDNLLLTRPFSMEGICGVISEMKLNTAPGPDGFPVLFFKKCWGLLKFLVKGILDDLLHETGSIGRINYGVLSLIPKVQGATSLKQYRPIAVLNVIFRAVTKVFAARLAPVALSVINPCQIGFIKGRQIYDGVVVIEEVLHDLRVKKASGIILKLDFEKAHDRVDWEFMEEVLRLKGFHHS